MTFGEKLLFLRKQKKYTQEDVAKHLGVAKSTYCGYEIDNREPSLEKIKCLSELFNVPPAFLLGTGVFSNWEEIVEKKDMIFSCLHDYFPNWQLGVFEKSEIGFIHLIQVLFDSVVVNEQGGVDVYFNNIITDTQKSTAPAETGKDDANKQKLMNNYDLLNNDGQQDLVDYSDMLAGNPRKIKESDKVVSIDA